jgi:hypothetical protein
MKRRSCFGMACEEEKKQVASWRISAIFSQSCVFYLVLDQSSHPSAVLRKISNMKETRLRMRRGCTRTRKKRKSLFLDQRGKIVERRREVVLWRRGHYL